MPEIAFAFGSVSGMSVGYLMRSESRQYEADFGGYEDVQH